MSPQIVNELLQMMSQSVLQSVVDEVKRTKWYSIMADETRDISNREQLVIYTTAETIFNALKDCLIRLNLPMQNCRGQADDGASNFQDHISGVAKKFMAEVPSAISVHCRAHCVNRALQEAARKVRPIRDALDFAQEMIQLFTL